MSCIADEKKSQISIPSLNNAEAEQQELSIACNDILLSPSLQQHSFHKRFSLSNPEFSEAINIFSPIQGTYSPNKIYPFHDQTRLLLLAPWMQMGGADRFNLDLLRGLSQKGYHVSIATTLPDGNAWADRFLEITPDVFCLPDFLPRSDFPAFLHSLIQSREIDVLMVSNTTYGYYMVPWLRAQFPHLVVIDYVHMPEKAWRSGGYARLSGYLSGFLDKTYTCNNASRRQLIDEYHHAGEQVETVYVGVDADSFSPDASPALSVRGQLGIDPTRPIILFPCRMAPQKRPFLMLEIARRMRDKGACPAFVAAGDGPDMDEMRQYIAANNLQDTVYLAGPQRELRPFYREAALTLICSLYEGLALTAYESMAMETPVITSDVGGMAELVTAETGAVIPLYADEEKDGAARSFAEEEVSLYVDAIECLLGSTGTLRDMGHAARKRVLEGFTVKRMVDQMDAEIQAFLRQKRGCDNFTPAEGGLPLLYEELAILAGEFEMRETLIQRQNQQLADLQQQLAAVPPPPPTLAERFWRLVTPVSNAIDHIPGLRLLLSRNRRSGNEK